MCDDQANDALVESPKVRRLRISLLVVSGETASSIARSCGVSRQRIRQIALSTIRKESMRTGAIKDWHNFTLEECRSNPEIISMLRAALEREDRL